MENDKFSLEDSSWFIVGELSDTTVAIFMPIGVEIINKKKTLEIQTNYRKHISTTPTKIRRAKLIPSSSEELLYETDL